MPNNEVRYEGLQSSLDAFSQLCFLRLPLSNIILSTRLKAFRARIEEVGEEQTVSTVKLMYVFVCLCFWSRAKGIKTKLGTLLQKPENAIDLIIPYPEKPEKKPEKLQK